MDEYYKDKPGECLWIYVLGGCGCGTAEEFGDRALKILKNFDLKHMDPNRFSVYDNPVDEIIAHWLDSKDLIEHGSSIGGSWLSDKGKELLKELT